MGESKFIELCLLKFNLKTAQIIKKKFGQSPEIIAERLLSEYFTGDNLLVIASRLGTSNRTLERINAKYFSSRENTSCTLLLSLLYEIGYKRCYACKDINTIEEFHSQSKLCKICASTRVVNKDKARQRSKQHYLDNKGYYKAKSAAYRARSKLATPAWADLRKISEIYLKCPKGYEVDHIIPFKGKLVSGLHVEYNLQYLSKEDNRSKSNNFSVEGQLVEELGRF